MQVAALTASTFRGQRLGHANKTNWPATSEARRKPAFASRAGSRARRWDASAFTGSAREFADARIAAVREQACSAAKPSISPASRAPGTHNSGVALVEVTQARRPAPDRQQRGRALFRQQAHDRISEGARSTRWSRRCARWGAISAISTPGSPAGIIPLAGTMARSVLEEAPQSLKLLRSHRSRRLRRPPPRPDDAHAENSRPAARPCRTRAADLHAASRQPCLVFVRRLAVRRR